MPRGLKRYHECGDLHFITFSCYGRREYLATAKDRDQFLLSLHMSQTKYGFILSGYVVMPEHVHLLISEPVNGRLCSAIQAVKQSAARRLGKQAPFWYPRYYDFNVRSSAKRIDKLNYMHFNPVKRGLCNTPEDWHWSSAAFALRTNTHLIAFGAGDGAPASVKAPANLCPTHH